jgi:hypothetical protein
LSVEEVHVPPKTQNIDPNVIPKKPGYWETQAQDARARREYLTEQRMSEELMAKPPPNPMPESPFKVTGGINLGNFDIQEAQRKAEAKAEADRLRLEEMAARERQDAQRIIAEERIKREQSEERSRQLEIASLKEQMAGKMVDLERMIAQGRPQSKPFVEQYEEVMQLANKLGLAKQEGHGEDPRIRIEMLKLQAEMAREERNFKRELRNDEKKWNLELAKLDIDKQAHADQIQSEKRRSEMFSNAIKGVGSAIAAGLMKNADMFEEGSEAITQQAPSGNGNGRPSNNNKKFIVEADYGRAGEVECPGCGQMIGIGPQSATAKCSSCGFNCQVNRAEPPQMRERPSDRPTVSPPSPGRPRQTPVSRPEPKRTPVQPPIQTVAPQLTPEEDLNNFDVVTNIQEDEEEE